jgi:hypothetical protein
MGKPSRLNIREHLKHGLLIEEGIAKFGYCPAIEDELKNFSLLTEHC